MDNTSLAKLNPAEIETLARECDAEAHKLGTVVSDLITQSQAVFSSWDGNAAESLNEAIQNKVSSVRVAQASLRSAAAELRTRAGQVREAIHHEEDKHKREEEKRRQKKS